RASAQDVAPDHRDKQGMFEIVIKSVASSQAFDRTSCQGAKAFGDVIPGRAEYVTEILNQELSKPFCRDSRNRFHPWRPWMRKLAKASVPPIEGLRKSAPMDERKPVSSTCRR